MVRRRFHPLFVLAAIVAAAGSVTAAGLTFTARTVEKAEVILPKVTVPGLPSYVVRLPDPADYPPPVQQVAEMPEAAPPALTVAATPVEVPAADLRVVGSDVSVRSGPSKQYDRLGTLTGGMQVNVTAEDGNWVKVSYSGGSGWVYGSYLDPVGNTVEASPL